MKFHFRCAACATIVAAAALLSFVVGTHAEKGKPELLCYSGLAIDEANFFAAAFNKYVGGNVNIKVERLDTGLLSTTLEKQGEKCPASVMFGGSLPAYLAAADKGLFQPYQSPEAEKFDKKFKDPGGRWIGIYVGIIGFATNEKLGVSAPESWADLLKPEYKGKIEMSNPEYSGTAYITVSTLIQLMGEEAAFEYLAKLDKQIAAYPHSGSEPAKMAAKGSVAVGISFAHDILNSHADNPKLKLTFPREGTGIEIGGAAILKHAPNTELAREFIDFLASPAAQNLYGTSGVPPRFPTNPSAKNKTVELTRGKTIKLINFDFAFSAKEEARIKKKWTNLILSNHSGEK
jgi:iron(III) transport system substrate-binding protein